jgi:hypothetical protein
MELGSVLSRLWARKLWLLPAALLAGYVALSVGYRVTLDPPSLTAKGRPYGIATTEILVDTERSSAADLGGQVPDLAIRASLFADVAKSQPITHRIGSLAALAPGQFEVFSLSANVAVGNQARATTNTPQPGSRSVVFAAAAESPIIEVTAQGRTAHEARRLANAGAHALQDFVGAQEIRKTAGVLNRVRLRQLGEAKGGTVWPAEKPTTMAAIGGGIFLAFCMLVLLADNAARARRMSHARRMRPEPTLEG